MQQQKPCQVSDCGHFLRKYPISTRISQDFARAGPLPAEVRPHEQFVVCHFDAEERLYGPTARRLYGFGSRPPSLFTTKAPRAPRNHEEIQNSEEAEETPAPSLKHPFCQKFSAGGWAEGGRRGFLRVGGRGEGAGCQVENQTVERAARAPQARCGRGRPGRRVLAFGGRDGREHGPATEDRGGRSVGIGNGDGDGDGF
jgi:hypothetical protein